MLLNAILKSTYAYIFKYAFIIITVISAVYYALLICTISSINLKYTIHLVVTLQRNKVKNVSLSNDVLGAHVQSRADAVA